MRHITRGGLYVRVCDATWTDCGDTQPSKRFGGRWNPAGRFGVLYLCADLTVAASNARWIYEEDGRYTLFDRRPERRPHLQEFTVRPSHFVDAVTPTGLVSLRLPKSYPLRGTYAACSAIGARAYEAHERGIACRSAAEPAKARIAGEELALFDSSRSLAKAGPRHAFRGWYPLPHLMP